MSAALQLARIALQAQGHVVRGRVDAALSGAAFGSAAAAFGLIGVMLLHAAALSALLEELRPWLAFLVVAGADLVLALILLMVARSVGNRRMRRAVAVRDTAMAAVGPVLSSGLAGGSLLSGSVLRMGLGAGLLGLLVSRLR